MFVLPQTRSRAFYVFEKPFRLDDMKLFKNIRTYGWAVLPQTRPNFFHGFEEPFSLDVMQPLKHTQVHGWAALPNIFCLGQAHFAALKNHFHLIFCRFSTTFKWTDGRAPPNTFRSLHGVENSFHLDGMKLSKNIRTYGWAVLPQTRPSSFHGVEEPFHLMLCSQLNTLNLMAGPRFPSSPVTAQLILKRWRTISFCCCADFNNVQMNGWSCSPKHNPVVFTVLKFFFFWMVWSYSKTFELAAGPCSPKHGPVFFTVLRNRFVYMFCRHLKTFKLLVGPRSPTSSVTAQLISQRWKSFRFDVVQVLNNVQINGWSCFPKHGPGHFTVLKTLFIWMVESFSITFELMVGPGSPKHGPVHFTV